MSLILVRIKEKTNKQTNKRNVSVGEMGGLSRARCLFINASVSGLRAGRQRVAV